MVFIRVRKDYVLTSSWYACNVGNSHSGFTSCTYISVMVGVYDTYNILVFATHITIIENIAHR